MYVRSRNADPYWMSYGPGCFLSHAPKTMNKWITVHVTYASGTTTWYSEGTVDNRLRHSNFCGTQGGVWGVRS